ncbi:MAG: orotidine-5'-phosphate decarboxylase [Deltaproteobacteria bacterium]|nr:orotidine-5'-phosphate decarboxylase [Deltaproteobacteria bacterium]
MELTPGQRAARARLCFALDVPERGAALELADRLAPAVGCFKVGLELFVAEGPDLVRELVRRGAPVFLDLKLHDIPATVGRAARVAESLGACYLTVHADPGGRSVDAAVRAAPGVKILLVTVLTSIGPADLAPDLAVGAAQLAELVSSRARLARESGCAGVVCSGGETARVRAALGAELLIVNPGIRPAGSDPGDQRRAVTPAEAIAAGAGLLVVGRPIRDAADPLLAAQGILAEMAQAARR